MIGPSASAAEAERQRIGLHIGRRNPEGKTARRAFAYRSGGAALARSLMRRPARPAFRRIEGHDADRIFVFAREQIENDRFEVGALKIRLTVDPAVAT
jgi:RNase P protein component